MVIRGRQPSSGSGSGSHTHPIDEIEDLRNQLGLKAPIIHTHTLSSLQDIPTPQAGKIFKFKEDGTGYEWIDVTTGTPQYTIPEKPTLAVSLINNIVTLAITLGGNGGFGITSIKIRRMTTGAFAEIFTTTPNMLTISDDTAVVDTTYHYEVIAVNPIGDSIPSDIKEITTPTISTTALPVTSGLVLHLDADDSSKITKDSDNKISQWDDKSENVYSAIASTITKPIFTENIQNSKSGIVLDGTNADFDISFSSDKSLGTMFIVAKHDAGSIRTHATLLGGGNVTEVLIANGDQSDFYNTNGNSYYTNQNSGITKNGVTTNNFAPLGQTHIFSANPETQPSLKSFTTLQIGKERASYGNRHWKGAVFEIIIYNRILMAQERADIESYLSTKWGISI